VNVSRLFITLHRWAEGNLATAAFEPNDVRLWSRIERELNAYLFSLWQRGALQGEVPEAGFWVRCDVETNPPESRDLGQVITLVGLAPSIPNEFIQVRLIHGETGVALAPTG
jgi:phage tail sheath protein FI